VVKLLNEPSLKPLYHFIAELLTKKILEELDHPTLASGARDAAAEASIERRGRPPGRRDHWTIEGHEAFRGAPVKSACERGVRA
jgi:hypothetical protein